MKSLLTKTTKIVGTTMLLIGVSPLLPVIGLMYLVAAACDEKVEPKTTVEKKSGTKTFSFPQSGTSPRGQYVMSH